ncbi:MAG: zinc-binding dehydrogenase [Brooklawnia sp.]|uniref:zinc-binding dehydrogenase n=1 Tax=Brooklawnia sp. TaxID=2699740 RepID=UPI003C73077D
MQGQLVAMNGVRNIQIREYPVMDPGEGQVVMGVTMANICGSDIHMWEGKHIFRDHVMGHEMAGVIARLGKGVTTDYAGQKVAEGDRIVPVYYLTCQRCEACTNGLFNICTHGSDFMGARADASPHFTGGFATHYFIQPNQYFYRIPDNVSDQAAAGANCGFTQMLYAIDQLGPLQSRGVAVLGAGGLGLYSTAIASAMGARVVVVDSVASRLSEALAFGAEATLNMQDVPDHNDRAVRIKELLGAAPDVVIDVTGAPAVLDQAIRLCRIGGQILEVGAVSVDESQSVTTLPGLITRKCLTIRGVLRYQPWYLERGLRFLSRFGDRFPFDQLTDRFYPLDETQLALQKAANKEVARAIIRPNGRG